MPKSRILGLIIPVLLFSFTLTVYILTLSRSVYYGDSGEFIAVAKTLGVAHPPGYPLYTMLAHLFTYLPFGNIAFKVNLFSAVTSSLTVVVIYLACLKLTGNRLASASASLILAFSYLFWLYSLVAEVFSLNNLFVALIVLISLHIFEKPQNKKLFYLLSFVFALALTNHHTIVLLAPALLFLIFATNPKLLLQPKFLILNSLFIILGLLPYLYLPIRASADPILNWGDPDTVERFLHVILRKDFGTFSLSASIGNKPFLIAPVNYYFLSLFKDFLGATFLLVILGILFLYKKATRIFFFLLLCFFFLGPVFVFVSKTPMDNILIRGGLERFFIASLILIPIAASASVHKFATKFLFSKYIYIVYLLFILVPIALLFLNFSKVNQKRNYLYEEFGELMFAQLPPNSLLITFGDKGGMISRYMQVALNKRTDVLAVNFNFIPDKWYKENLQQRFPSFPYPYDKFQPFKLSAREAVDIICKEVVPNQPTFIENKTDFFNPIANNNCSYHMQGPVVRLDSPQNRLTKEALIAEYQRFWQPLEQKFPQRVHDYKTRT
ncbi:MAG: DUF2723 domain-containing protein, partial [Candidatus Levybacteria bacterium]|nr:DUF2723 domain-containing protein [Candidatus Levybacteria bacterium]